MDHTLAQVRDLFTAYRFHHLIVTEAGRVVGVLSDRDLLKHLSPFVDGANERAQDRWSLNKKVHQIMTRRLVSCTPETPLAEAGALMRDHRVHCLPIVDDRGHLKGILTMRDMLEWALVRCAGGADTCAVPPRESNAA
jgi:acetoin utilization protein AcuB